MEKTFEIFPEEFKLQRKINKLKISELLELFGYLYEIWGKNLYTVSSIEEALKKIQKEIESRVCSKK